MIFFKLIRNIFTLRRFLIIKISLRPLRRSCKQSLSLIIILLFMIFPIYTFAVSIQGSARDNKLENDLSIERLKEKIKRLKEEKDKGRDLPNKKSNGHDKQKLSDPLKKKEENRQERLKLEEAERKERIKPDLDRLHHTNEKVNQELKVLEEQREKIKQNQNPVQGSDKK